MNRFHRTLTTVLFAFCLNLPVAANADSALPEATAMPPMHAMHDLMREIRQDLDPEKCSTQTVAKAEAVFAADSPCKNRWMAAGEPCRTGVGGKPCDQWGNCRNADKPCNSDAGRHCRTPDGDAAVRLNELEKRMDMLQLMLEMLLRSSGSHR